MNAFKNPLDPENIQIRTAIRKWVMDRFMLDDLVDIQIIEHQCAETSCVHAETVISVINTDGTSRESREGGHFYKIAKPLVFIRKIDVSLMQPLPLKPQVHRH